MTKIQNTAVPSTATPPKQVRKAGDQSRERILDAAEKLFALQGYHGSSLRDIALEADSRLALVTHHFTNKETLFSRVVERKSFYLSSRRIDALDEAKRMAAGNAIPIRSLIAGYLWPFLERWSNGGPNWKHYTELIARLANSSEREVIRANYDAVARLYLDEFKKSLCGAPEQDVYYAFNFMVGIMLFVVSQPDRVQTLSFGKVAANDLDSVFDLMVSFTEQGFTALVRQTTGSVTI